MSKVCFVMKTYEKEDEAVASGDPLFKRGGRAVF